MPDASTRFVPALPTNVELTASTLIRGAYDPCVRVRNGVLWRACMTPHGPATASYRHDGEHIAVEAWGAGAEWVLAHAPELLGSRDSLEGFEPTGKLKDIHRRHAGLRVPRTRNVYEALLRAVIEQRVQGQEAARSHQQIVRRYGVPAPGPEGLFVPPLPEVLGRIPTYDMVPLGIERKRAASLHNLALRAKFVDSVVDLPNPEASQKLQLLDGVGPWTAAEVALTALGDADAVPVGDANWKNVVSYAFTGEPRGDDTRMLELLAPYAGHRGRVLLLIAAAGITAPRLAPRRALGHPGMSRRQR
ncbi:MAG: DNA-3-methyladenine glycosylase 2 family protein [Myxococcota bacterium]